MDSGSFRFDRFCLQPANRQLTRDGVPVDLNARYLDALSLLVGAAGTLVSKERFLDEVWRGVPVTDEALTQCIKTLRNRLGDSASKPRFIETVPKHGYRFIAPVDVDQGFDPRPAPSGWRDTALLGAAGTIGGGMAGFIGGVIYGFAGATQPLQPGPGAVSVLLVVMSLCILVALMGGAGVAFGIAAARYVTGRTSYLTVIGGAAGGMLVGGAVKLLGIDAFNLLLGQTPGDITGAAEGLLLGGAVGLGAWLASRSSGLRHGAGTAAICGGVAGAAIPLLGGRLMGGSLDLLSRSFPASRLRLDRLGALAGEDHFGPIAQVVTGALEGALFAGCVVGAMILARRSLYGGPSPALAQRSTSL